MPFSQKYCINICQLIYNVWHPCKCLHIEVVDNLIGYSRIEYWIIAQSGAFFFRKPVMPLGLQELMLLNRFGKCLFWNFWKHMGNLLTQNPFNTKTQKIGFKVAYTLHMISPSGNTKCEKIVIPATLCFVLMSCNCASLVPLWTFVHFQMQATACVIIVK